MTGTINGEPWADVQARLIASARRSHPIAQSDLEAVCLSLSHLQGRMDQSEKDFREVAERMATHEDRLVAARKSLSDAVMAVSVELQRAT